MFSYLDLLCLCLSLVHSLSPKNKHEYRSFNYLMQKYLKLEV